MSTQDEIAERLREARKSAGYATAADAAKAMGLGQSTYTHHDNGTRGVKAAAERYAAFFRVSLEWLLTGRGERAARHQSIPVVGLVGAGSGVFPNDHDTAGVGIDEIDLPDPRNLAALEVRGDSQYPRYLNGEIVLYDTRPHSPGRLVNQMAVVDLVDGRRLIKMLRRMPEPGKFRLESHNAAPEDDAAIEAAYLIVGTLTK